MQQLQTDMYENEYTHVSIVFDSKLCFKILICTFPKVTVTTGKIYVYEINNMSHIHTHYILGSNVMANGPMKVTDSSVCAYRKLWSSIWFLVVQVFRKLN